MPLRAILFVVGHWHTMALSVCLTRNTVDLQVLCLLDVLVWAAVVCTPVCVLECLVAAALVVGL